MMYTIRVELHDAQWPHYNLLAQQMAARGMTDVLTADNGTRWKMPPGEYNYVGLDDTKSVLAKCNAAAAATGKRFAVLVTQGSQRIWDGLNKVL